MSDTVVDEVTKWLFDTSMESNGVSFEGKSLKLDTEDDARDVIRAINSCRNLHYLNLEGNTLGVDAAKGIAKSLEGHHEFKRALWKDMFTGRLKSEIPKALQFLGSGLLLAGAQLLELDLSDNAFGPIGVEGLAMLLRSSSCHALQILKLNNNGLGIEGGKILSRALLDCYNKSTESGRTLALKVFIAGRNRLENEGAKALAEVFRTLGTLEEVAMPQNGIYHVGITALSEAFIQNPNLRVLNLNDNIITAKGAAALAVALPSLQNLQEINLGDCLLKTKGAILLANALTDEHKELQKLNLGFNEIGARGGLELARAMRNKEKLLLFDVGGNQFGETGQQELQSELKDSGRLDTLGSLSEDEDEDEEEDDDDDNEDDDEDDEDEEEEENDKDEDDGSEESESEEKKHHKEDGGNFGDSERTIQELQKVKLNDSEETKHKSEDMDSSLVSVTEFLQSPTPEHFLALGKNRIELIMNEVKNQNEDLFLEKLMPTLMKVSSLNASSIEVVQQAAHSCSDALYKELFKWAEKQEQISIVNNSLLVHLGLIKSEDKKLKLTWNLDGCMIALEQAIRQDYFPRGTQETLQLFLSRPTPSMDAFPATKHKLMSTLFQF